MFNEFQNVMDSLLKGISFTNCYIEDTVVASKETIEEHKAIVQDYWKRNLDENNMAVNRVKFAVFQKR